MDKPLVLSQIEAAYIAGVLDGEGCIRINETKPSRASTARGNLSPRFRTVVFITNTSDRLINWLQKVAGGRVDVTHEVGEWKATRTCYRWSLHDGTAIRFLQILHPYLIVKKDQAEIVFRLKKHLDDRNPSISHCAPKRLTEEELSERRELIQALKDAKKVQ